MSRHIPTTQPPSESEPIPVSGGLLLGERHHNEQPFQHVLDNFIQARHANLKILEGITEPQLARMAYLESAGEITSGKRMELWVEYDRGHVKEPGRLRK